MKKALFAAAFVFASSCALAESVKVTVGHMCCGGCKAAATAGLKSVAWSDNVTIEDKVITVNAKAGMKTDVISLMDALNRAGFPASEINTTAPVTLTVAHLCCGACVGDLKTKIAALRGNTLDKDNVKIDQAAKTLTIQPAAGMTLNVVPIISQLNRQGFSFTSATVVTASNPTRKVAKK